MKLIAGRYRPVETLGFGGMCVVWRGVDEALGRPVALKVLNNEQAADEDCFGVMREEARAAASLSHPNLVKFRGYVARSGAVRASVTVQDKYASGSGRLSGASGRGTWSGYAGSARCSGYWSAQRN